MDLTASESQMSDFGDIHHATMGCISDFKACLSIKPLMKEGWAESRLADLNLWASGVGALARPDVSLDLRLQFQPKPRMVLINLLLTLRGFISSCRTCALNELHDNRGSTDSKAESEGALASPAESTAEPTLDDDSDPAPSSTSWFTALASGPKSASDSSTDSNVGDDLDNPYSKVTLKEVMKDVDDILDQLILLGFAIRKSGTVARLRKADSSFRPSKNKDLQEHLEFILLNSVARRQKNMKDTVVSTTGERIQEVTPEQRHLILANLRRRHRFRYARRHQQKLDQLTAHPPVAKAKNFVQTPEEHQEVNFKVNKFPASNYEKSSTTEDFLSTPSTAPPQHLQVPEMSATTPSVAEGDILPMAMSTAAAASRVSVSVATMHYPSPPPVSQKMRGFKCPCCYQTLPEMYKNWSRWRKHLVEDLCPYTCPFPECPRPEVLYISRAAWRDHVLQSHGAGQIWECLACVGTGIPNKFSSAEEFVSHNRTKHTDAISEDQIAVLQDTCRKMVPPNIAQCPLCPWPQDEEAVPDAVANLEHVGNCIHEFSLYALPWAESMAVDATDQPDPALREKVEVWFKSTCTEEEESTDMQKVNIETFIFFPTQPLSIKQEGAYIPEEYFAESSNESSQAERGTLSLDSDLPEARGTYSDDISDKVSEESAPISAHPQHDDYTVGWICAVGVEYVAARDLLDEEHKKLEYAPQDNNNYTLGSIGKHNVVIATSAFGEYGIGSAAAVARDMMQSFHKVKICLMVGIGGGAPSQKHDIRIGDVVVGTGGLLHYDYGRSSQNERFEVIRISDQPPLALRRAVNKLQAQYEREGHRIQETAAKVVENNARLRRKYKRPDQLSDRLYQADAIHPDTEESCLVACDTHALISRVPRDGIENHTVVHYGLVASSNQLMKNALLRDKLAAEKDVLCFEMEAAGLMSHFPCLVIRGICDYSDSHKNKESHGYAALVAAAYVKDLLYQIAPSDVAAEKRIRDILSDVRNEITGVEQDVHMLLHKQDGQKRQAILDWLTSVDYASQQHNFISKRQEGTGQWFLQSPEFQAWLVNNGQTLFCPGIPGAGKTIISAIVVDHLLANFQHDPRTGIAYIYCSTQRQEDETIERLLANLLKQLAQRQSSLPKSIHDLYEEYEKSGTLPSLRQITAALHSTAAVFERIFFVIDAIDECQHLAQTKLLDVLFNLLETRANILATSRINDDIERLFDGCATVEISADAEDILAYLNGQLSLRRSSVMSDDIQEKIRDAVLGAAGGSFESAISHIDRLVSQPTRERIEEILPKPGKAVGGPHEFFKQAMERIEEHPEPAIQSLAKRTLIWIIHAKRPLSVIEIQHALTVREDMTKFDSDHMPHLEVLKSACVGLVTTDEESGNIRLVNQLFQEFFQQSPKKWFPEGESYITKICLTYMLFTTFGGALCQTDKEIERRLTKNPLYGYAACNWGHHARESSIASQEIMNFLESTVNMEASSQILTADRHEILLSREIVLVNRQRGPTKMTGLHLAAYFGIERVVDNILLQSRKNPLDSKDIYGRNPLSWAAENGHVPVVEQLVATGQVEIDSMDSCGMRPLIWAAKEGHTAIAQFLLDEGAHPSSEDYYYRTPLSYAIENDDMEIIQLLFDRGAETELPEEIRRSCPKSPLSYAAENGNMEITQLLLDRGAETEIWNEERQSYWRSPLSYAAEQGHIAIIELLLASGAKLNLKFREDSGWTPLIWAVRGRQKAVVELLLERGADVDVRDVRGRSALSLADDDDIAQLLLDRGAKPEL